jgi:hypothetical protein
LATAIDQLAAIRPSAGLLIGAFFFAVLTWASDLAVFLFSLRAVGVGGVALSSAVVAYAAGLATVSISVVPAGIGTVEAGMLLELTHAGATGPMALAGVVTYRIIAYVLVAAAGWLVWAGLRRRDRRRPIGPERTAEAPGRAGAVRSTRRASGCAPSGIDRICRGHRGTSASSVGWSGNGSVDVAGAEFPSPRVGAG